MITETKVQLEVIPPKGKPFLFNKGKMYDTKQKAINSYNNGSYATYDRNINDHKAIGYNFNIITVLVTIQQRDKESI